MKIPILFLTVVLFCTACQNNKEHKVNEGTDNTQDNQLAMVDSLMSLSATRGVFNGNILIAKNNELIYQNEFGYTDASKSKKNHSNSLFNIGSIAKEFNAVGIMILAEKKLLTLDDKISKFGLDLPQWADSVSVRNLLQYTSGLPRVNWRNIKSDEDIYSDLKNIKHLNFEAGTNYLYSNNNIFLQRRIIEKVSKMTFNAFLQKHILTPSGMEDALIDPSPKSSELVTAFNNEYVNDEPSEVKISGWVNPTTKDMYKWLTSLHSGKLISRESLMTLFDAHSENTESALGHGVFENNKLILHRHQGSHFNYESLIYYNVKEGLMVILMTNNKNFQLDNIAKAIENISAKKPFSVPQKSVYLTIREKCYENVEAGIEYYKTLKKDFPDTYNFSDENELNRVGYKLIGKEQLEDAIKIFQLLVSEFPNSANPYDSIGEAYYLNGNTELALVNFKKSLELNPANANAKKMIAEIESK